MIYLENTTQSQQVYIPRQVIQTATTREINNITSGDVINIVDSKLEGYYTSAETDTKLEDIYASAQTYTNEETANLEDYIDSSIAAESARSEETYAKIEDIPDVSNLVTSEEFDETVEGIGSQISALTDDFDSFSNTINELSGTVIELQQSISGFASEEYVDNAVDGAIDYVDDQFSSYSQEFTGYLAEKQDITAMTAYYTSAETDTAIENAIAAEVERADSTYATPSDIPDVSEFITTGDLASYALSADVDTLVEDTIAAESARTEETYAKPDDVSSAVNELALGLAYLGVVNDVSESNGTVTITKTGLVSGEITTGLTDSFNLPDVSNFVTSADVETQITGKGYALSGDLQTLSGNVAQNATDIYDLDNAIMTEYWNSAKTSSEIDSAIDTAISAESGRTERTYAKLTDIPDVSNFVTSADVETQIDGNLSAYTPTSGFATINGSGITSGGNLVIQGGGGGGNANIIELTQQEYDALTAYTEDALYVITDAEEVDLNDYATSADVATINTAVATINTALGNKADKVTVTTNSSYYRFPKWNSQGIITGYTEQAELSYLTVNGTQHQMFRKGAYALPTIYAPTTAGDSGQVVVSNGSGAPSWSSFKFWYGSQLDYDLIYPKDNLTIYFITD